MALLILVCFSALVLVPAGRSDYDPIPAVSAAAVPAAPAVSAEAAVEAVENASTAPTPTQGGPREQFAAGYTAAGGNDRWREHFLDVVIPCESGWDPLAVSPAGHLGLAQFSADSWQRAGGGDWRDPYTQGGNTARWVSLTIDRGTDPRSQWSCW